MAGVTVLWGRAMPVATTATVREAREEEEQVA